MEKNVRQNLRPFGMRDKIGYMFGDFGNDFTFILASMFLMKFYTDVMGISAAAVGLMMMLSRIVDAFTDIGMGQLVDRSPSGKDGKFKQWMRRFMGPVALASFLMYAVWFKDMSMGFKVFWMYFTYLLWGSVCYTGINIPYGSMASAITDSPNQRTELSSARSIGATLAQLSIGVIAPIFVYYTDKAGNVIFDGHKMMIFSLICSVLALICYTICIKFTTERVQIKQNESDSSVFDIFKAMLTSKSLIGLIVCAILLLLALLTMNGMANYIYPSYFKNAGAISVNTMINSAITFALSLVIPNFAGKIGKKEVSAIGCAVAGIVLILAYFMKIKSLGLFYVVMAIATAGLASFNIITWAMIIDVIDDIEVKTGNRDDGTIYGSYSFARKLGQAASSGLTGALLSMVGYTTATAVNPQIAQGIYNIATLFPGVVFIVLSVSLTFIYPLSKKVVDNNSKILKERRENK
ncbi:MAG: MFS transporter [Peptoniphilaceae bacterium]|nr:MFS transporter [Peptoniphilaceae bacterium]MDY6019164.1 MFS transporter [Anaerococcus sp.]